jgi:hypothetical protein
VRQFDLATFSMGQEDYEAAMTHLEKAFADQDPSLILISTLYEYNPLRKDLRFIRLIEQLGVANGIRP